MKYLLITLLFFGCSHTRVSIENCVNETKILFKRITGKDLNKLSSNDQNIITLDIANRCFKMDNDPEKVITSLIDDNFVN